MAEKVRTGMNAYAGMTMEQRKAEVDKRKQIIKQMLDEGKDMKQIADETGYHYRTVVRIRQEYFGEKGIPLRKRSVVIGERSEGYLRNFRKEWIEACNRIRSIYGLELQKSYEERYEQQDI